MNWWRVRADSRIDMVLTATGFIFHARKEVKAWRAWSKNPRGVWVNLALP
mgnify:CR=1 FL=1